jgi:DNA polymerase III subunit epsilon
MNFVVIDVETANPSLSSICQIEIAPFRDGVFTSPQEWLVNPDDYFDPINVSIHGIDERIMRIAPKWPEVYAAVTPLLSGNIVVSHTAFDRTALTQACGSWSLSNCECRWLDTARVVRRAWPQFSKSGYQHLLSAHSKEVLAYRPRFGRRTTAHHPAIATTHF